MNLIFTSTLLLLKFGLFSSLSLNELKINNLSNFILIKYEKYKDFLDVDVLSDFIPSITEIVGVSNDPNTDSMKLFNFFEKNGQPYQCWIDSTSDSKAEFSGPNDEILKQIILNRRKSCYYFKGATWVYEYCHLKSTRQVSRSKINDNHEEFSLGRFYPPRRSLSFSRNLNYLTAEFFDGSYCELTGSPRSSRIRFICANEKQSMHLTNVMETSACMYDFIVHVPELCGYLPKHSKKPKTKSKIKCLNYSGKKTTKFEKEKSSSKANSRLDGLDQMLSLIESTYKDSSILSQYKNLLLKATENRKSQQLAKEFVEVESDSSLLELLTKLSRKDQVRDEDEDQKNNE